MPDPARMSFLIRAQSSGAQWFKRLILLAAAVLGGALSLAPFWGRFLSVEDPITNADAVFVLAGARADRWLEAADLYREGRTPRIVLTAGGVDGGEINLQARGVLVPTDADIARSVLVQLGIPSSAIVIPQRRHSNTAAEAITVRDMVLGSGWRTVIVVTSKAHTRRARLAVRRALDGTGATALIHPSRYDTYNAARWWEDRGDIRWTVLELQKLVFYAVGLGT